MPIQNVGADGGECGEYGRVPVRVLSIGFIDISAFGQFILVDVRRQKLLILFSESLMFQRGNAERGRVLKARRYFV